MKQNLIITLILGLFLIIGGSAASWQLSDGNFLNKDDFSILSSTTTKSALQTFTFLPNARADRPVAELGAKNLFQTFSFHYRRIHISIFLFHLGMVALFFATLSMALRRSALQSNSSYIIAAIGAGLLFLYPLGVGTLTTFGNLSPILASILSIAALWMFISGFSERYSVFDGSLVVFMGVLAMRSFEGAITLPILLQLVASNTEEGSPKTRRARAVVLFLLYLTSAIQLLFIGIASNGTPSLSQLGIQLNNLTSELKVLAPTTLLAIVELAFLAFILQRLGAESKTRSTKLLCILLVAFLSALLPSAELNFQRSYWLLPWIILATGFAINNLLAKPGKAHTAVSALFGVILVVIAIYSLHNGAFRRNMSATLEARREDHKNFDGIYSLRRPSGDEQIAITNIPSSKRGKTLAVAGGGDLFRVLFGTRDVSVREYPIGTSLTSIKESYVVDYNRGDLKQLR